MLSDAPDCAAITDLCRGKGKRSKTGGKKARKTAGEHLVLAKVKGEEVDGDRVGVKSVDGKNISGGEKKAGIGGRNVGMGDKKPGMGGMKMGMGNQSNGMGDKDNGQLGVEDAKEDKVCIKRCELNISKISLEKLEDLFESEGARVLQIGDLKIAPASPKSRKDLASELNSAHKEHDIDCSLKETGGKEACSKKAANAKSHSKSCDEMKQHSEKIKDKVFNKRKPQLIIKPVKKQMKETAGLEFSMKRCDVSIGRVGLAQLGTNSGEQTKQGPPRKSPRKIKASSNSLAGPYAFVSNFDETDSSVEILGDDHRQDLSWELGDGDTWNETNKQSKKERKSDKKHHSPDKHPHHQVAVSKKRRQAPLASDDLDDECIVDLKHYVEDEVEDEAVSKDEDEGGQHVKMFHSTMVKGYDCINADPTYICVFCHQQPHRHGLGDLFGPYFVEKGGRDVWAHVDCAVWVPCVFLGEASGEVEGLSEAIRQTRKQACSSCNLRGASIGCTWRGCTQTVHVRCAAVEGWKLEEENFEATCSLHLE